MRLLIALLPKAAQDLVGKTAFWLVGVPVLILMFVMIGVGGAREGGALGAVTMVGAVALGVVVVLAVLAAVGMLAMEAFEVVKRRTNSEGMGCLAALLVGIGTLLLLWNGLWWIGTRP